MNVSELIGKLQTILDEHGDMPVCYCHEIFNAVDLTDVIYQEEGIDEDSEIAHPDRVALYFAE